MLWIQGITFPDLFVRCEDEPSERLGGGWLYRLHESQETININDRDRQIRVSESRAFLVSTDHAPGQYEQFNVALVDELRDVLIDLGLCYFYSSES